MSAICCRYVYRFAGCSVPSRVSRQQLSSMVSLLSNGSLRAGSPPSPILRRRYAILHCIPVAYGFASGFRASLPCFVFPLRAPGRPEAVFSGQGHFHAGFPHSGFPTRTTQDFSGSLAIHPMPLPCSTTPAEFRHPHPLAFASILPPHPTQRRLQRLRHFVARHTRL